MSTFCLAHGPARCVGSPECSRVRRIRKWFRHAPTLQAAADDGKALGVYAERLRVAVNSRSEKTPERSELRTSSKKYCGNRFMLLARGQRTFVTKEHFYTVGATQPFGGLILFQTSIVSICRAGSPWETNSDPQLHSRSVFCTSNFVLEFVTF